jgi:hypothetical protein
MRATAVRQALALPPRENKIRARGLKEEMAYYSLY